MGTVTSAREAAEKLLKKKQEEGRVVKSVTSAKEAAEKIKRYNSLSTDSVDQKYIDSFINDANAFLTTAEKDYGGVGWANASSSYGSKNSAWEELNTRADTIAAWLYKNSKNIDRETYESLGSSLGMFRNDLSSVVDSFKSASDFYSQWDTEEDYNKWYEDYTAKEQMANSEQGVQGWNKYLEDQAKANESKPSPWVETIIKGFSTSSENPVNSTFNSVAYDYRNDDSYRKPNDNWTEAQKNIFGYLYMTSPAEAYQYAEETNNAINKAAEEEALKKIMESATSSFWSGAGNTIGSILTSPFGLADAMDDWAKISAGRPITDDGIVSPFEYSQAVTEGISNYLNEESGVLDERIPIIGGKGLGDAYGLGAGVAQSIGSAYTLGPTGTLISYFGQGAASGVDEALSRGATDGQAALYGLSLGVFEGVAESIGIDNLFKLGSSSTIKGFIKNILKQAGAEGAEEGLTSILTNIADNVIMQGKSNFNALVAKYMASGMSESEAKKKAWMDSVEGIAFDTIAGAASGSVSGGIHTSISNIVANNKAKKMYGNGADLVTEALGIDPNNAYAQGLQAKLDKGKSLSGGQINRLIDQTDPAKIASAVKARLTELGEKSYYPSYVSELADALTKQASGEALTSTEKAIINMSQYGARVANELNPENISSGEYSTSWAENIGTKRINASSYNKQLYDLARSQAEARQALEQGAVAKIIADVENAVEGKYTVSEDGKTIYTADGKSEDVNINKIVSTEGGKVKVELDNGKTVDISTLSLSSAEEGIMYEMVARMELAPKAANEFISTYKPTNAKQAMQYLSGVPLAYQYGKIGYEAGLDNISLTDKEKRIAYNRGRMDAVTEAKSQPKASATKNAKAEASKGKNGIIYENDFTYNEETASDVQKASMACIETIAKMSSLEVHVYESYIDDNGKRVYKFSGREGSAPNGFFTDGNKIYIDINAGNKGEGAMLYTMSHEVTHYIRKWNAKGFKVLGDFLIEQYGEHGVPVQALLESQKDKIKKRYKEEGKTLPSEAKLNDMAYEELVADAMSDMFADPKAYEKLAKLKQKNHTVWQKLGEAIKNLLDKLKSLIGAYKNYTPDAVEAHYVRKFAPDVYEKLQDLYLKAFVEADANYEAERALTDNGIAVNSKTESGSIMSVRDVLNDNDRQKVSKTLAERFGVTQNEAMDWLKAETSLASLILNPKYSQYLDYTADASEEAIKSNSDYPQGTVDFSNICKKRRDFTEVMNRVLRNFPNHVFAATDLAKIRTIMEEEGMEVACAICYVEDRRQLDSVVAQDFIDSLSIYRSGGKTRPDGKPFNANQLKAFKLIEGDTYAPSIYELISLKGRNSLKAKNPAMEEAWVKFNNARGMQSVRLLLNDAEYKRQILKYSDAVVKRKNDFGGLRIYSFSDAEMFHLIDIIQVITDSATVGLSLQGYTKVNEYARAVKDTGEKLNRSLIPKGDLGYHMEDGKVVLDFDTVEGIDINHPDFFDNIDNPNIGNIVIGINATQIKAAMTSKFIDQIIPFHTGQSNEVLSEKGIATWENYKDFQSERDVKTGKKSSHQINIYTEVINAAEAEGHPITNKVDFVNKFLEVCKENDLIPRFSDFLNVDENGNFVYTEGYHKFLVDFKTFDQNTGEYLPQMPVKPIFDNEYITNLLEDYVKEQKVKDAKLTKTMPKVLDRITKEIVNPEDMKFSSRDSHGNELSAEQQAFYKDSKARDEDGNLLVLYHGTSTEQRITEFKTTEGWRTGLWLTTDHETAVEFAKRGPNNDTKLFTKENSSEGSGRHGVYELYANVKNPLIVDAQSHRYYAIPRPSVMGEGGAVSGEEINAFALENGYDGVIIKDVIEGSNRLGTDVIVFSPNQAKYTDNLNPTEGNDIRYSFRDSESGMANDLLSPYNDELAHFIRQRGDYVVDSFEKLEEIVTLAFDDPKHKATAYFGIINTETLEKIKNSIPNLPKAVKEILFKEGRDYSIATTFDSIRHIVDDKGLNREDVIDYLDRLADTILEFDTVTFDYYYQGGQKTPGLLFKKEFEDGTLFSFNLVSHKKRSLVLHSLYLDSVNYQKKKSAKTLLMQNAPAYTPKAQVSQTPVNSIPQEEDIVNSEFSDDDEKHSDRDNIGYHAGDLGKAEFLYQQGRDRGTGHFGTGTYFVGNEERISGDNSYGKRPHHAVDFSDYNLYKIKDNEDGWNLHEQLREIDGGFSIEWLEAAINDEYSISNIGKDAWELQDKYDVRHYDEELGFEVSDNYREAQYRAYTEIANKYDVEHKSYEEWLSSEGYNISEMDDFDIDYYKLDYAKYLRDLCKEIDDTENDQFRRFSTAVNRLRRRFGYRKVDNALREVFKHQEQTRDDRRNFSIKIDSFATIFMKALGYEGIDVRGTKLDNVEYGSVIYDIKEDSVLYQDRDSNSVSNRTLLANALESVAQNDIEKSKLAQYKAKIGLIESEQKKLSEIKAKANELRSTKGKSPSETKQMRDLDFEATQIANRISTYDKQLLNLESTSALKNVLEREKKMLRKKLEQKGKDAIKAQKEKAAETVRELMTRHTESRKKAIEGRHKTEMRHKIKDVVSDLNKLLLNPTKDQHVPIGLQRVVAEALDVINMDAMNAEERVAYYNDLISKSSDPDEIKMLTKKRDFFEYHDMNFKDRITALKNAYSEFKESEDPLIRNAHNDAIEDLIKNTADEVGNKSLKDMSYEQLEAVYDMYKAIKATVRNANKLFKEGRQETVTENSESVKVQVKEAGGHQERVLKLTKFFKKFGWNMLKPVTAMKVIGSKTFAKLFDNVRSGEDTWAVDVNEAKQFYEEMSAKYGYNKWNFKERFNFKDSRGEDFSISLEQIMSLYAYSKREQADKHLEFGGFIFDDAIEVTEKKLGVPLKYEVNDANPHRLGEIQMMEIIGKLTTEQKGFIDEMQTYLSDVMGAKGNEVSLALYDIKLYKEKNYFPLKTARYFREFDPEKSATPKIKNSGFSKKTVPQAGNPIVLSNFMDVWASHVNDMSMYHAFVLPLEDFMRVYNYSSTAGGYDSVQQYIKNAYGSQANQYIETLMNDLNGGARVDPSADPINKGISLFKKASVFASASVVVQQPSAIARAFAYINPKHFATSAGSALNLMKHKSVWAEIKKYAPVAVIKEMGYFDTGMGRSTVEWIKGNRTLKDKVDDVLAKAPAIADELSWSYIWLAVKNEIKSTTDLKAGSDEFLKRCGERFTEVITNTQVYDSVLSRSGMMRSKDTGMKMATAFMAEPTTTVNMMVDGILQGKRGNKKFAASTVGAVSSSIILNSILVALVYAARDDDEDETYAEKYIGSLTTELLDGFNPLTYVPFVKDIWSIAQGYDVERSDMSVVSKLWESIEGMFSEDKSGWEKVLEITGSISSLFGIPLKNIIRDGKGIYNLTETLISGTPTTDAGIKEAIGDSVKSSIPLWDRLTDSKSNPDRLYDAIMSGDQNQIERIKGRFKDEDAIVSAMKQGLRENDSRIHEAAQAKYDGDIAEYTRIAKEIISEGKFSQDTVVGAINAEISAIKKGETTEEEPEEEKDRETSIYSASDINAALDNGDTSTALDIIDDLIETKVANGMTEKEAKSSLRSSMTSYWKPLYKKAYESGNSSEMARIRKILYASGLYGNSNEVVKSVNAWLKD